MSIWTDRDVIVLRWLHERPPPAEILRTTLRPEPHPDLPSLSQQKVHLAIETLIDEGLLDYNQERWSSGPSVTWTGLHVSGAGLQALGEWPAFDALSSPAELGQLLDALAGMAESDEEESNLRRAATTARSKSGEVIQALATGALGALARGQLG